MPSESKNWCPEIYRGVFIDKWNNDKIRVAPCCQAQTRLAKIENFNFYTDPYLTQLRQEFDSGLKPSACNWCWQDEAHGKKSKRLSSIEFYNLNPSNEVVLEAIDHSSTWACNLSCVMCGPQNSSSWATELNLNKQQLEFMGRSMQKKNTSLDMLDFKNVKKIHFNGGEPLLNYDQSLLLNRIDLSDVTISYNTNGTIYPDQKIIDTWASAKLVKLFFSIDAIDCAYEYIRWPAKWEQVSDNLLRMREKLPSNVMFGFNTTIGCYNALEIADLWYWFKKNISVNREGDTSDFCYQYASRYDIKFLKLPAKQDIVDRLSDIPELSGIVSYTKTQLSQDENPRWIYDLDQIDARRNTSWHQSLKIGKFY